MIGVGLGLGVLALDHPVTVDPSNKLLTVHPEFRVVIAIALLGSSLSRSMGSAIKSRVCGGGARVGRRVS